MSEYSEHPQLVTDGDRADEDPRTFDSKILNIFFMRRIFWVFIKYFYLMVRNGGGGRPEAHVSPPSSLRGLAAGEVLARGCEAAGGGVEAAARAAAVAGGGVRGVAGLRVVVGAVPRVPAQRAVALLLGDAGVRVALGHVSRLTWHGAACRRAAAGARVVRAVLVRAHCSTTTIRKIDNKLATIQG